MRWCRFLSVPAVLALAAALPAANPFLPPKPAQPELPDLKEFRSVENAITCRISRAAPVQAPQPAYLGVSLAEGKGPARIAAVQPGSPADKAGLKDGDLIRKADNVALADADAFRERLAARGPGDALALAVERGGKPVTLTVTLGAVSRPMTGGGQRAVIGLQTDAAEGGGVRISQVTPNQPAAEAGLKVGDVLLKINGMALSGPDRLSSVLGDHRPGEVVTVTYKRDGKEAEVKVTLAASREGRGERGWDNRAPRTFKNPVYRLAVVGVEFPDVKHNAKIAPKNWEDSLFSKAAYTEKSVTGQPVYGSLNDYYVEQSCGGLRVEGKMFDYVQVNRKRAEYGSDSNRYALLTEALDKLQARDGADALKGFDGVFFLYAGDRVQTSRGSLYWPHKSNVRHGGKSWDYFICPEGGDRMASISVVCHEFGHMLGLPDLYARPEAPGSEGLGVWCTMATGHGRDGKPLHFSAWCKEQMGWLTPALIDPAVKQKLILAPVEGSAKECFKVLVRPDGSEYLLLENRVRKGFDRDLPGEGLLIWRVVDNRPLLEVSHGSIGPNAVARFLPSVPYPSAANDAYTPLTTPSSRSVKGGAAAVHITNIRRLPDGRITFFIGYEYL
jgi:M6 family metalloprotease-like protein